jgi:hypothetical protein
MRNRKIIYKSWFPTPIHIGKFLNKLKAPELRLYIALSMVGRGTTRTIEISNNDLKKLANLTDDSLPNARKALTETHRLITAYPADKRKEIYFYELVEFDWLKEVPAPGAALAVSRDEFVMVPVPREVLFR